MNQRVELPVNLPDTADLRGYGASGVENSAPNASGEPVKGKTETGLTVRPWTVYVSGFGHGDYIAPTRGNALAQAWRSSAFEGWTFGEFLKHATCRLNRSPWERFGNPITVADKPAFLIGANKQYVEFVRPGESVVFSAHPFDVQDESSHDWPYWAKRPERDSSTITRLQGGEGL